MNQSPAGDPASNSTTRRQASGGRALTEVVPRPTAWWLWVMCLLGVDYFSSLAYQPSLTYELAGPLGPVATLAVVLLTLLLVLPMYLSMAGRSPHGEGSVAVLEKCIPGWRGKTLILLVLGFAATDFVMLRSISLSDAAEHVRYNSFVAAGRPLMRMAHTLHGLGERYVGAGVRGYVDEQVLVSLLLGGLSFFFWYWLRHGFTRRVIQLAIPLVGVYLAVNAVVIGAGLDYLNAHRQIVTQWWQTVEHQAQRGAFQQWTGSAWPAILGVALITVPKLSLGFSGFELSMILMSQVEGFANDDERFPRGRIRHARYMLTLAAILMSTYLLAAVFVVTILVPKEQFDRSGLAAHRALAYLAHGGELATGQVGETLLPWFGPWFGTLYDLSAVLILCFAGSSVMTAMSALVPRILLRFGMELEWSHRWGVLFTLFALVNLLVTVLFQADVDDQRGAYATGVLALILSTSLAAIVDRRRKPTNLARPHRVPWYLLATATLFALMWIVVIATTPSGLLISACFITVMLFTSIVSRALRTSENRTIGFEFVDEHSRFMWDSLRTSDFPVLVPHRPGLHAREAKEQSIRSDHHLNPDVEIVFVEVEVDDPSNFYQTLLIEVTSHGPNFVVRVRKCASVPHAIAAIALELSASSRPPGLHFGWSELGPLAASWNYLAFGEGNVPWKVRELLLQAEADPHRRPRVVVG